MSNIKIGDSVVNNVNTVRFHDADNPDQYVRFSQGGGGDAVWGDIQGNIEDQVDLMEKLDIPPKAAEQGGMGYKDKCKIDDFPYEVNYNLGTLYFKISDIDVEEFTRLVNRHQLNGSIIANYETNGRLSNAYSNGLGVYHLYFTLPENDPTYIREFPIYVITKENPYLDTGVYAFVSKYLCMIEQNDNTSNSPLGNTAITHIKLNGLIDREIEYPTTDIAEFLYYLENNNISHCGFVDSNRTYTFTVSSPADLGKSYISFADRNSTVFNTKITMDMVAQESSCAILLMPGAVGENRGYGPGAIVGTYDFYTQQLKMNRELFSTPSELNSQYPIIIKRNYWNNRSDIAFYDGSVKYLAFADEKIQKISEELVPDNCLKIYLPLIQEGESYTTTNLDLIQEAIESYKPIYACVVNDLNGPFRDRLQATILLNFTKGNQGICGMQVSLATLYGSGEIYTDYVMGQYYNSSNKVVWRMKIHNPSPEVKE